MVASTIESSWYRHAMPLRLRCARSCGFAGRDSNSRSLAIGLRKFSIIPIVHYSLPPPLTSPLRLPLLPLHPPPPHPGTRIPKCTTSAAAALS